MSCKDTIKALWGSTKCFHGIFAEVEQDLTSQTLSMWHLILVTIVPGDHWRNDQRAWLSLNTCHQMLYTCKGKNTWRRLKPDWGHKNFERKAWEDRLEHLSIGVLIPSWRLLLLIPKGDGGPCCSGCRWSHPSRWRHLACSAYPTSRNLVTHSSEGQEEKGHFMYVAL